MGRYIKMKIEHGEAGSTGYAS